MPVLPSRQEKRGVGKKPCRDDFNLFGVFTV
ncbi:hypothetical protein SNOG_05507 [Parastagonospora nodorum SN15]|uniref:Uncharacterized protein n=1 Tax=Phaeosphaeria nodorum (strain SN15 / ATCC MYA-4574 / FGSC 10173) TaxID=321614 RepID=Q0URV7_PHANO|nr:hypothetical protein SNOG_05507 [Parastagonospora nodorum SN15]EAT86571.1 hypothetical protein SNOG_05507 [Parastagonospora nodorum SN15]